VVKTKTRMIRTDSDTTEKLRNMAGGKSLGAFLRDIANGVEQKPLPVNEIESLRASFIKQLETLKNIIHDNHSEILRELNELSVENDMLNSAIRSNPKLSKELDSIVKARCTPGELELLTQKVFELGLFDKINDSGITMWDANMYREVIANPSLLKDKAWLKNHGAWGIHEG
jgi:hypothetical protein